MNLNVGKSRWTKVRLGDVATEYSSRINDPSSGDRDRFVGSSCIGQWDFRVQEWESTASVTSAMKLFEEGDYLLVRRSLYASDFRERAPRAHFAGVCSGDILTIRENPEFIADGFLIGILNNPSIWSYIVANASGSITRRIKWKDLANYEFLLPPKDQQAEIAELLWAFDSSIEQMQSFLEEIKTSLKTIQNELFGCGRESVALGELCQSFSGFPFKSKKMTGHGEHKLLRGINIKEGCFEWNEEIDRFYPVEEEDGRKMTSIVMELGDVVVPMDGSKLGKNYAVVDDKAEGSFLVQRIACFKVTSVLESNLLEAFFGSVFFERMVQKHNTTSAIPHISLKQLRAIDIPVINASLESTLKHYSEMRGIQALSVARLDNSKSLLQAMIASFFETHV